MLSRLVQAVAECGRRMEALEVHGAIAAVHHFWLRSFCDVYLVGGPVHLSCMVLSVCPARLLTSPLGIKPSSVALSGSVHLSHPTCCRSLNVEPSPWLTVSVGPWTPIHQVS